MTGLPADGRQDGLEDSRPRREVAIVPAAARGRLRELLRALEEAFPVRFVDAPAGDASAVVVLPGGTRPALLGVPCLVYAGAGVEAPGAEFELRVSRFAGLHRVLRGQCLTERGGRAPAALTVAAGAEVLAVASGRPAWVREADGTETVSGAPVELGPGEFLRDHLKAGRFWALLPLFELLRRVCADRSRPPAPIRACFILDDPNVRFSSYGYVSYPALARDAREHGYHVAIATIPLDLLLPGRRAAAVFRDHPGQLSLVVHGNDHVRRELGRSRGPEGADRLARAALARVGRFERRAGVRVERVMCPPHGACSADMLAALFRHGFRGLAASRPFPWEGFAGHGDWRLGGWLPAQLAGGGLPVISRYPLAWSLDDVVFRALLGQPVVLYGHQSDLRTGLEPLRAAAARVATLGEVKWTSLAAIARANAVVRQGDGEATVTVYSRDVRLPRPAGRRVRVEIPRRFGDSGPVQVTVDDDVRRVDPAANGGVVAAFPQNGRGDLRIRIDPPGSPAPATLADWRPRAWPLARRAMTEARDRALPLLRRP
ncbi:MAG TPA: hypothetical protein VN615_09915 [Gaiellales bacterium]|nr:hypothetical protein [Gaiellales bacterium]